jgi:ATP-dependent DNA ligase
LQSTAGINSTNLNNLEKDASYPGLQIIAELATALEVEPAELLRVPAAQDAYLDGKLCGVLPDGRTAFNLIQNAADAGQGSLVFFLFDLLFLDGEDIRDLPLVDRKARLEGCWSVRRSRCGITSVASIRCSIDFGAGL